MTYAEKKQIKPISERINAYKTAMENTGLGGSLNVTVPHNKRTDGVQNAEENKPIPLEGYKWPTKNVTICIVSTNPTAKSAFQNAINGWNQTGEINFQLTNDKENANIVAGDQDLSSYAWDNGIERSERLGQTEVDYDPGTGLESHATSNIDINKLAQKSAEYQMWVAEHELGHAIGLDHATESDDSVMVPYNPKTGITKLDAESVRSLYK